ncbi:ABC transporter ATP-binding protein [Natronosporangium hydrolyticum]|uniref:ABC transporter ATP-binding protein n=2 Tax=Natronosporangium hydrolyticum TaxID=2811111 RepID=A0A895YGQ9_9ACTN|nr:ABC transporter ATP-binding protein [Natronosporangium hydrolyticum]
MVIHSVRRKRRQEHDTFWPLRNLSFDIQPGEAVGIIGRNGTGKSTLLRLIAGVLKPDEGDVLVRGKVAPLIQLSAGFSGDLTGRENVYLVASLHGMTKKEIKASFDEIVDFAGDQVKQAIDSPVRHYSSGMKVRLAFSLVSRLPHPILLVDEALAVGDREFKKKCYKVIDNLLAEGRTLVLVSHSQPQLTRFCKRGLFLDRGQLVVDGTIQEALDAYNGPDTTGHEVDKDDDD